MITSNNNLDNKRAFIIGGTGGIGLGIAKELAAYNVSLTLLGGHSSIKLDEALKTCAKISTSNGFSTQHSGFLLDLSRQNSEELFQREELNNALKTCDVLVISHGKFLQKEILNTSTGEWNDITFSNLVFPGICISHVLPHFIENKYGRILCFGGTRTDSVKAFKTNAVYAAAKTGLSSLVKSVAAKHSKDGVTCNLIAPGFVDTEYVSLEVQAQNASKMPHRKCIKIEEIAKFSVSVLSNSSLNGALINFDEGWEPNFS